MPTRMVVTVSDDSGLSRVCRDGPVTAEVVLRSFNGVRLAVPWEIPASPADVRAGAEPVSRVGDFLPPAGGVRLIQLEIPPRDPDALLDVGDIVSELRDKLPGMLPTMVPDKGPGMHRTPTIDLLTVVRGRVVLVLGDGSETELAPGDCVVQQGTLHSWRNPFAEPCLLTGVLVGVASPDLSLRS